MPLQSGHSLVVLPSDGTWPAPWQKVQCLASLGTRLKPLPIHTGQCLRLESIPCGSGKVPCPLQYGQRFSIIMCVLLWYRYSQWSTIALIIHYLSLLLIAEVGE